MLDAHMLSRVRRGAAIIAGVFACVCTSARGGTEAGTSERTDWRLVELNGHPATGADLARRPWVRLEGDSGRVEGSGGCNRLSGTFTRTGSSLKFGPLLTTKMACADAALNSQEQEFLSALQAADTYETVADTLTLMRASNRIARFVR
jgi:putative lipoprotein